LKHIDREASILETGCGMGGVLYFLHEQGYKKLSGYDIDEKAVSAGQYVCKNINADIEIMLGDGFDPGSALNGNKYDVIIGVNWIYHVPEYSLEIFIGEHIKHLCKNGYIVFELIDSEYNSYKNNEYCTQDWDKPVNERRSSEYLLRYSNEEVKTISSGLGLKIVKTMSIKGTVPHKIYVLKYCGSQ
jgi:2-polyprenyl-3-methyl-5-hydroxy-6-metoxy-1,4-benzoquinol methylase